MRDPIYDKIGHSYASCRQADPRIVDRIVDLLDLPSGSIIADIGAGTGNYSRALADRGMRMKAVEPSSVMRAQAASHPGVEFVSGFAENIPLPDGSVDGVISVVASHHFSSLSDAFAEMARICDAGPIVLFTFDPREVARPWFADYFPTLWESAYDIFPALSDIACLLEQRTKRTTTVHIFEMPHDLQDQVAAAGWHKPELYLDPTFRACNSAFALADQAVVERGVEQLRRDLDSGEWEEQHASLREQESMDLGYRLLCAKQAIVHIG